ncbi:MAG: chemotaxis protein CheD [Treponema sp.]|nr:chemotaxis protein CheD [Treponema sp.]
MKSPPPAENASARISRHIAMHRLPPDRRVWLQPGEHRAVAGPWILSTLLGSCISACLYDGGSEIAGMNHFLLAGTRYAKTMPINLTDAGRYGINAMELLINDMLKLGASKSRIRAKIFGGAIFMPHADDRRFLCVGEVNKRFIHEFLALEGIATEADDTGGYEGRVIHFHTDSHKVFRRFIRNSQLDAEIAQEEKEALKAGIIEANEAGTPILF